MNFIFISPQFPRTYWEFCNRLKKNGVNVLGIADTPYDSLSPELKDSLTEYYRVDDMNNYGDMFKAVAYLSYKYGKIDWLESNNEFWLEQDARLRTDFNITSGIRNDSILSIKEKSEMKKCYFSADIPTARQIKGSCSVDEIIDFANTVGYPLVAKPDIGVGAQGASKIHNEEELRTFCNTTPDKAHYVFEEFITGHICSYDAIVDSKGEPIFESMTVCPPSIMEIVNKQLDLAYYVEKETPQPLKEIGRRSVKAFGVKSRFVHLEFFRLDKDHGALGSTGDFVALEVNMRPAGGYTPDMMNFAHSTDVYKIWADMIVFDRSTLPEPQPENEYYCAFASRRDRYNYRHSLEEIRERFGRNIVMCERMPDIMAGAMGNQMVTARFKTIEEKDEFIDFVQTKAADEQSAG